MTNYTEDLIANNISVQNGTLYFANQNTVSLAKQYGTPLYLIDEDKIRANCQTYFNAVSEVFGNNAKVLYASKALSFKYIYKIVSSEHLGFDVVSSGEIKTALSQGVDLKQAYFHSNNKTDEDINYAMKCNVGYFVVDNVEELLAINDIASSHSIIQKVLLRITPGIDPHTFDAVSTGKVDSKFGSAIETNQADEITKIALSLKNIKLMGFHCHVGSQVFEPSVYLDAAKIMLAFIKNINDKYSFETQELNIGGGFGVRYVSADTHIDIKSNIKVIGNIIKEETNKLGLKMPTIIFEPGRSIVADTGMTLYTVGTVKRIPDYKNYISVDGGMTDNPRFALYRSKYTLLPANKMNEVRDTSYSIVGRCCESGDIIQENISMPSSIKRGDIIACLTTGAYNYSMASNYNRIPRPPIVVLKNGESFVAVKRETLDDIISLDL